jgi:hypothetical protein
MPKKLSAGKSADLLEQAILELAMERAELVVGTFAQLAERLSKLRIEAGFGEATISGMRYQLPSAMERTGAYALPQGPVLLPLNDDMLLTLVGIKYGEDAAMYLMEKYVDRPSPIGDVPQ